MRGKRGFGEWLQRRGSTLVVARSEHMEVDWTRGVDVVVVIVDEVVGLIDESLGLIDVDDRPRPATCAAA